MRLLFLTLLFSVIAAAQKDPKTYYEQLGRVDPTVDPRASLLETDAVTAQIGKLTTAQVKDLLPAIFAAVKRDDLKNTNNAVLGLYAVSMRPDSAQTLKPHLREIAEMFNDPNPGRKATAGSLLMNIQILPEVPEILLEFLNRPLDRSNPLAINEKIDALTALTRLQRPPMDRMEAVAIQILNTPMPDRAMQAAIGAATRHGSSDLLVDAIAGKLAHSDEYVKVAALHTMLTLGTGAIGRHRSAIAKLAGDPKETEQIRQLAKKALDAK